MIANGMLVTLESRNYDDGAVEALLATLLPLAARETATRASFAVRFGHGHHGLIDIFGTEADRQAHTQGAVGIALLAQQDRLLTAPPGSAAFEVLAHKLPVDGRIGAHKGLLLRFKAPAGAAEQVAQFLRDAETAVEQETGTAAWFALQFDTAHFGAFGVFADSGARFAHLTGHVPRELARQALSLLGGMPDLDLLDVVGAALKPVAGIEQL